MSRPKKWPKTPVQQAVHHIQTCTSVEELRAYWNALNHHLPLVWADEAVIAAKDKRKDELTQKDAADVSKSTVSQIKKGASYVGIGQ